MSLNKKILAAAILGGLSVSAAQAQVVLTATTTTPVTYAEEIIASTDARVSLAAIPENRIQTALLQNFSAGEVRHARIECSPHIRFLTGSTVTLAATADSAGVVPSVAGTAGSVNGIGTNAIHFSITSNTPPATPSPPAPDALLRRTDTITVDGPRDISSNTPGTCSFSLYDQPSQAANGGETGRIVTTGARPYLAFAPSYTLVVNSAFTNTASVEATPVFSAFTNTSTTSSVGDARIRAQMGRFTFSLTSPAPFTPFVSSLPGTPPVGQRMTLFNLMASETAINVAGDFSASLTAGGTGSTAAERGRVFLGSFDCSTSFAAATTLTATNARFNVGPFERFNQTVCQQTRGGVAIPVADYTIALAPVVFAPVASTFRVTPRGTLPFSNIVRDGTELQAPLAQVPAGWVSRMVLTNNGSVDRNFTIRANGEPGASLTINSALASGVVRANSIHVVTLSGPDGLLSSFVGSPPRAMLNVTVDGPNREIQGMYQIFNTAGGGTSLSNHVMVRPGTN